MRRRWIPGMLGVAAMALVCVAGCGESASVAPAAEPHDVQGEHLSYPAAGPDSPEYKTPSATRKVAR